MISVDTHPLLDVAAFSARFPGPLGEVGTPDSILGLFDEGAPAPLDTDDALRTTIRDLLRHGGFKPTGRNKPASEYLRKAVEADRLSSINAAVDVCNAVSLHSGLPISVVDLDRTEGALRIGLAAPDSSYVFNPTGQEIRVAGLLCLHDTGGPCANAVKDAQRTKTSESTTRTCTVIWGSLQLPGRTRSALSWYLELLQGLGASTELILTPS